MSVSVEAIVGYDADGRPHEVIVVDGHEAAVTCYELDPDARSCEVCGMWVERIPDRRYAWALRARKSVLLDGQHISAGQAPTLKALPGCFTDQHVDAVENVVAPRYGVFVRCAGEKAVLRMTPASHVTAGDLHAAVFPDEDAARRRADEFRARLQQHRPGSEVWTAPL